jgi:signal peptidase II
MKADYRRTVFLTVVSVIILDQLTKLLVLAMFAPGEVLEVIPGLFNLTLHFNPGVAFGLFAGLEPGIRAAVLIATTSVAVSFVLFFMWTEYRDSRMGLVSLALVLGGAIGNAIDRLRLGQVVDFFDFYIGTAHWPTFNVADSAICIGVGGLLLHGVFEYREAKEPAKAPPVSEGGEAS